MKFWDIGNEPYGVWQLGRTDLKYYVLKHNEFATEMRKVDPSITLLASGAMPDEMTVTGQARTLHMPDPQAQFGSAADFTGGLLAHSWGNFEGLTEHWYAERASASIRNMQKACRRMHRTRTDSLDVVFHALHCHSVASVDANGREVNVADSALTAALQVVGVTAPALPR